MPTTSATGYLRLAEKHLDRVGIAWTEPTDWTALSMYGLYALEAAVLAAATHLQMPAKKTHWDKIELARRLVTHGLPDVADLLEQLNVERKAWAYGDDEHSDDLDAEDVAAAIEAFIAAVRDLLEGPG